jgi:hypothetical protein
MTKSYGLLKQKGILFLEKLIVTLSPAAHIKLDAIVHAKSHRFSLLPSSLLLFCLLVAAPHPILM